MNHLVKQVTGHQFAAPAGEIEEHVKLHRRQRDSLAVSGGCLRGGVDRNVADRDERRDLVFAPAKNRPDPCQQFPNRERLGEIVVGTKIQRLDTVVFSPPRGYDNHRHGAALPEFLKHVDAVEFREHQVENDELGSLPAREFEPGNAVGRLVDGALFLPQTLGQRGSRGRVVFDHKNAGLEGGGRGGWHPATIAWAVA